MTVAHAWRFGSFECTRATPCPVLASGASGGRPGSAQSRVTSSPITSAHVLCRRSAGAMHGRLPWPVGNREGTQALSRHTQGREFELGGTQRQPAMSMQERHEQELLVDGTRLTRSLRSQEPVRHSRTDAQCAAGDRAVGLNGKPIPILTDHIDSQPEVKGVAHELRCQAALL
eukprot:CAMPEP_0119430462 /NCGR_PEP_ID=MMETSP1335-20130426/44127_1 /TAXON_ID=259385 /ORGANISM="Chrysoculter rhomboideus, Strain RCC1486" /LENGTH=172 /DNA_ID=CAMNT_0007456221 /DNA_START=65 /DNA_END=581 /DNA_ORIENTATION=+